MQKSCKPRDHAPARRSGINEWSAHATMRRLIGELEQVIAPRNQLSLFFSHALSGGARERVLWRSSAINTTFGRRLHSAQIQQSCPTRRHRRVAPACPRQALPRSCRVSITMQRSFLRGQHSCTTPIPRLIAASTIVRDSDHCGPRGRRVSPLPRPVLFPKQ